ncbi:MAG: FadR family transcriptional regulator [Chloroflexi bacterium]|nr:FadR family transcriptional regulator [Chloroflexota bacterium]
MAFKKLDSNFLNYLVEKEISPGEKLPSLNEIGDELGISVGKLREQLEVARNLGLVSVRPRVGIHRQQFSVAPALLQTVLFGLATDEATFEQYGRLRRAVETSFWHDAVRLLTPEDKETLKAIVAKAWSKLRGQPVHVPNREHRQLHLLIFHRLENPFVQGIISTYWEAYEASELTRFVTYQYWIDVWTYHERIVEALCQNDFELGRKLLTEHFEFLPKAP